MKVTDPFRVRVGQWTTLCCHLDLEQIRTEERIQEIREDWVGGLPWAVWETRLEALEAIWQGWTDGSDERRQCEEMIRAEQEDKP